jgi:hypothetical protein
MVLGLVVGGFHGSQQQFGASKPLGRGDTITANTTLNRELVNCSSNGFVLFPHLMAKLRQRHRGSHVGIPRTGEACTCQSRKALCPTSFHSS